jgi:fatty acid elongase 2
MSLDSLKTIPLPSLERPFGIELWPIFDKAFSAIRGYSPTDFKFVEGVTPISTLKETATVLLAYYVIIFGGRELMRGRNAFTLNGLFMIHNFYLTVISGILLALFIEQLLGTVVKNGVFYAVCNHKGGWTKELVMLYYVCITCPTSQEPTNKMQLNYITKYIELIDTIFLVLKKKPLSKYSQLISGQPLIL